MSNPPFVVRGPTGGAPNRLDIRDFVKNEKHFSLYIQALQAMQKENQSGTPSFFQVGGIHGLPYVPWNGVRGQRPWNPDTTWGGYCTHGSVLFPTWHRPYMLLFEQIIQQHALKIAATYTVDKPAWNTAATQLRQPFWDWAANAVPPDEVIALTQVTITAPDGKKIRVDNPLYHYTFHPIDSSFGSPYTQWASTLRQPTVRQPLSSMTDNVPRLRSVLQAAQGDITTSTYNMLTRVIDWTSFSNHTVGDGGSTSNSIEAIHDGIHVNIGGRGHMSNPAVAAFDPIFFLHHCNVDRMLSLWSALHPGVWVNPNGAEDGTFTIPAGTQVNTSTPLTPFWNGQTTFWSSAGTVDTSKLGYTYPDFNGLDMGNPQAVLNAIANRVNNLYGSSIFGAATAPISLAAVSSAPTSVGETTARSAAIVASPAAVAEEKQAPVVASAHHVGQALSAGLSHIVGEHGHHGHHAPHVGTGLHLPHRSLYDWTARIEFKQFELGCSFSVLLFLGEVPEDPDDWQISNNYVGGHHAFVNSATAQCANCATQADVIDEGFVHLNQAILKHSGLNSLEPNVVVPYLTKALKWRVQKNDGDAATLASLEVCVYGTPLSYPPGAIFPARGERRRYNDVTHGRDGGSRQT